MQIPKGTIDIHCVLKIPDLTTNLLSVRAICKHGHTMIFLTDKCKVLNEDGELVVSGSEEGDLYRVNQPERTFLANGIQLWHT